MANIQIKDVQYRNFSGGLNTRDNPSEIAANEVIDAWNVSIDERGSAEKRLGYANRFGGIVGSGLVSHIFYWAKQDKFVSQIGAGMHLDDDVAFHTWTTSDICDMTEFLGNLIMVHPVDGIRVYDGATVTTPVGSIPGRTIATWQNRVWVAQPNTARIWYSDLASTTISPTGFVDIREKDSEDIVCLAGAAGLDIAGRPGLLAFKLGSAYRIYDPATGAYNTIDPSHGAASHKAAVTIFGQTFVVNTDGIYSTDGLEPLALKSDKVDNFFDDNQINSTRPDLFAAGRHHNRLYFSVPRAGDTANSVALEVEPRLGWIMPHSNAASAYAWKGGESEETVIGSPSVAGRIYNFHTGGSDAGAAIDSRLQLSWLEPNNGNKTRIRRARFVGIGAFSATLLKDFEIAQSGRTLSVNITTDAGLYDSGQDYDEDHLYGPTKFQDKQDFYSLGVFRQVSIKISESSSLTQGGRDIIGEEGPLQGAWSLAYVSMLAIDLGFT